MGEIVTFYSYKGGVGRTMALANVATLLSQWSYKTLVVDWDLEAPGLEFFFKESLHLDDVAQKEGIADILSQMFINSSSESVKWQDLIIEISLPQSQEPLHFITAGRRNKSYFSKVRNLDLQVFYDQKEGGFLIESLRDEWKQTYDFVLVDSRTGVTDIGGICTIQLPDILVLLFSATEQSLNGAIDIAERASRARTELPFDRFSLMSVPIPSRFDTTEEFKVAQEWLTIFADKLPDIFANWLPTSIKIRDFLEIVKIPYMPYFSFGEKLPVLEQGTIDPTGLGYAYEALAALIANKLESVDLLLESRSQFVRLAARILPPSPAIPHNLPPRSEFVGREAEKARIHEALRSRSYLISIDGIGGIGKTALALEVAYECLQASMGKGSSDDVAAFDGFIWTTAKDRDLDLNDLLDTIARTLEYPGIVQHPVEKKGVAVRTMFQDRPHLLIVDNFETITDDGIRDFLLNLPEPSKALITTREHKLSQVWAVSLKGLTGSEALTLIRTTGRRLGLATLERGDDQTLRHLYEATGGVPLAIKWAVGQIKQRGQSLDTILLALHEAKGNIFDDIFSRSWNLLSADARQVLKVMSLFATSVSRTGIEKASGVHHFALDEALGQLVEMSLMNVTEDLVGSRYSIHPLTRAFATAKHKSNPQFVQDAFERALDYYRQLVTPPRDVWVGVPYWCGLFNHAGVRNLQEEWPNLAYLISQALDQGRDTEALNLFISVVHLLNAWGLQNECLQLSYKMCEIANRLRDSVEAWLWIDAIGSILSERRELTELERALEKGRRIARQFNMTDALILADTHESWMYIPKSHRNLKLARERIESALQNVDLDSVLAHSSKVHKIVVSRAVSAKSAICRYEKDFKDEEKLKKLELQLRSSVGESLARPLLRLVRFYLKHDKIQLAEEHLAQVEYPMPRDLADLSYTRALIAHKRGELQQAIRLAERALRQDKRFGSERERGRSKRLLERLRGEITELGNHDKP